MRDVERRLQMSKEWIDRPKPKAPIDEVLDEERQHLDEVALLYDLMALALQTDSTRVATLETGMGFRTSWIWTGITAFLITGKRPAGSNSCKSWNPS